MGAVHGVYLKYVGLSALSYAGYTYILGSETEGLEQGASPLGALLQSSKWEKIIPALVFGYSAVLNGCIACLFKLERGMGMIGKHRDTGFIPLWSYILYFPFHIPTIIYTHIHTLSGTYKAQVKDSKKMVRQKVPVASEVQPGWWVGGCYGSQLGKDWAAVVDLTVEFPEWCIKRTQKYLSLPTWDGVPCSPDQLEEAANFAIEAKNAHGGDVLIHCAHGRGRSTTVMCACLVKAGLFKTWQEALDVGIKPQRPVCKLNKRMQQNLTAWQAKYVDKRQRMGQ